MSELLLGIVRGLGTKFLYMLLMEVANLLKGKQDSSMDKDADKVIELIKKNVAEDKEAGFKDHFSWGRNDQ